MIVRPILWAFLLSVLGSGCADFPDLDERLSGESRSAKFPALLPIEDLTGTPGIAQIDDKLLPEFEARVAALQARAALLRRSVIDANDSNRLSQRPVVAETG
ncbi:MAG: hypothetical protein AAGA28_14710 [Pseudomonadota bacterium]